MRVLLHDVEVEGRRVDVEIHDGTVTAVGRGLACAGADRVVDGAGGALLPGLHDHHLHLLALAAVRRSVSCGPSDVTGPDGFAERLRLAHRSLDPGAWLRGVGYHESVAGDLDRHRLDALVADRPVRVQHRSGALWMLNTRAVDELADVLPEHPDVERDPAGRPTGRLWRLDGLLRGVTRDAPPLDDVDRELAALGLTGVTDATPDLDEDTLRLLEEISTTGSLRARVHVLGAQRAPTAPRLTAGPVKLLLHDHDLPDLDHLVERVRSAHDAGRPVAVHVVTRVSLALTLAALDLAGTVPGDRLEHAAVVAPDVHGDLVRLGLRVVTQPGFLRTRGDDYRHDVDPDDLPCLYPYAGLLADGIPVAPSSDAPYGELDPWRVMADAAERVTATGHVIGAGERVEVARALAGYLSSPEAPGGPVRRVRPGAPADLCLLGVPLDEALRRPDRSVVREVWHGRACVSTGL